MDENEFLQKAKKALAEKATLEDKRRKEESEALQEKRAEVANEIEFFNKHVFMRLNDLKKTLDSIPLTLDFSEREKTNNNISLTLLTSLREFRGYDVHIFVNLQIGSVRKLFITLEHKNNSGKVEKREFLEDEIVQGVFSSFLYETILKYIKQ